jgi:hypothetical protein
MYLFRWSLGKNGGRVKHWCLERQGLVPWFGRSNHINRQQLMRHPSKLLLLFMAIRWH